MFWTWGSKGSWQSLSGLSPVFILQARWRRCSFSGSWMEKRKCCTLNIYKHRNICTCVGWWYIQDIDSTKEHHSEVWNLYTSCYTAFKAIHNMHWHMGFILSHNFWVWDPSPEGNYGNGMTRQIKMLGDSYIDVFLAFPESLRRCGSQQSDCLSSGFLPPSSSACWDVCPSPATRTCCWSPELPLAVQLWIWKHQCHVCTTTKHSCEEVKCGNISVSSLYLHTWKAFLHLLVHILIKLFIWWH